MAELFINEITSIGAVEDGDNPAAKILLFKRREHTDEPSAPSVKDRRDSMSIMDDLGLDDEGKAKLEKHIAVQVAEAVAKAAEEAEEETQEEDPLAKATPELQELIRKQNAEMAELRTAVADGIAKQRTATYTELAKQNAPVLGPVDDSAQHLDALQLGAPEAFAWLMARVEKVRAVVVESNLLKELGSPSEEAADVQDQVTQKVADVMKANPELTQAAAKAKVWRDNPELVEAAREGK